ncbi:MAG: anthranilate/aminodeoxychorismate synthase component II [Candidatus Hydrogenedentes bacterium CG07_land_8_20_14_0_80_42_17]|nr:MAG: anthranilate/aminodeoxychorismate synthase component II [Candidatus Hydrogenedentes bacterium CG1_02_42_14]PIU47678.1 MAG: anthranilate/aminodeoxychorismate synthase component II [Candidatus Hydrogenedentes bacterium CG07_land_8_20_14_0_80_42_17]
MKRLLVIDNYDSFTYNLVQYLGELGAELIVKRNDSITSGEVSSLNVNGIIISPGPCTPSEAGVSVELIKMWSGKIPILGVCLGHQAIGAAFGAKIIRAPKIMHGKTSNIAHDGKSIFKGLPNPFTATRYHSLCVEEKSLPNCLVVTARVDDYRVNDSRVEGAENSEPPMGIRHITHLTEGVQFHPESILTKSGHKILQNFLDILP